MTSQAGAKRGGPWGASSPVRLKAASRSPAQLCLLKVVPAAHPEALPGPGPQRSMSLKPLESGPGPSLTPEALM